MSNAAVPARLPFWQRLFFAIPVLGWIAKEVAYGDPENIWYAIIAGVSAWGCAIPLFGLPGFYLPALAMVPIIWVVLILITLG
ncbi:hypothetical protein [Ruegeria jejuensis]|uniref:hypothetical protein n=1 Tax=Ruegeria jejuensis TaxID=3233338 RepID=UPI00355C4C39